MKKSELRQIIREELLKEAMQIKQSEGPKFNFKITIPVMGSFNKREYTDNNTESPLKALLYEANYNAIKMQKEIAKQLEPQFKKVLKDKDLFIMEGDARSIAFEKIIANKEYITKR